MTPVVGTVRELARLTDATGGSVRTPKLRRPLNKTLEEAESDICGVTEVSGLALLFRDPPPCSHIMKTTSLSQPRQESQPTDTT